MQSQSDLLIISDSDIMHYGRVKQVIYYLNADILREEEGIINSYSGITDTYKSSLR